MKQKRGQLTQRIKDKSKELLGYEITVEELRLIPFLVWTLTDSQIVDGSKINDVEEKILVKWEEKGYIKEDGKVTVTKKFWNIMCEITYLGYVDLREE